MSAGPLFDARNLTKRFQGLTSVDRVSFSVSAGEILALIGPNGAGKTTLVNLISGMLAADDGELRFEDRRIDHLPPFRRARLGIGRSFQVMKPFPSLTVLDNVAVGALFGRRGGARSRTAAREQARELLTFTGLGLHADRRADAL
ncbi:MAG TPA: ATP-binding cassette domain-containing protein, partial [Verrucomicrobiae bacterium]|nr:ATP-binding cassette domain-containing protein [Verrucomicrobiae bacterium]